MSKERESVYDVYIYIYIVSVQWIFEEILQEKKQTKQQVVLTSLPAKKAHVADWKRVSCFFNTLIYREHEWADFKSIHIASLIY